ncbi:MAG TPA: anti-sigma factor [Rubrobacteraceae bacterium]|nr:anti-sigma factor [Rubrobacteraceae bacterium]
MDRTRFDELKESYVLSALSDDERRGFEEYLRDHPECQAEIDELNGLAGLLALSTPEMEPSPELRRNLMSVVESEARQMRSATRSEERRTSLGWISNLFTGQRLVLGAAALAIIGLLSWNFVLQGEIKDLNGQVAEARNTGAQTAGTAGTAQADTVELKGSAATQDARVELVRLGEKRTILVAQNLPPIEQGKTYQLWIIDNDTPKPSGLFKTGKNLISTPVKNSLKGADMVAITVEPAGGSQAPTSTPMMSAKL